MSVAASRYAIDTLRADRELRPREWGARAVLLAVAAAADRSTHETYTGGWLGDVVGMSPRNVARNLHRLTELGYIAVTERPGRASVVRFPLGAAITSAAPVGRTDEDGAYHHPRCACPDCRAAAREA